MYLLSICLVFRNLRKVLSTCKNWPYSWKVINLMDEKISIQKFLITPKAVRDTERIFPYSSSILDSFFLKHKLSLSFSFLVGIINHLLPEILPSSGSCISVFASQNRSPHSKHFEAHSNCAILLRKIFQGLTIAYTEKPWSSLMPQGPAGDSTAHLPAFSWALSFLCPPPGGLFPMLSFLLMYSPSKPSLGPDPPHHLGISLSTTFPEPLPEHWVWSLPMSLSTSAP